MRRILARRGFLILLGIGLANLAGGLVLAPQTSTGALLDVVYANFGLAVWSLAGYAAVASPRRHGIALAATMAMVALVVFALLAIAGLAALAVQIVRGGQSNLPLYAYGLGVNLGWSALHFGALAVFARAALGRRSWLAAAATAGLCIGCHLAFDHVLIRFGAPLAPWSDLNGYGHFPASQTAAGVYWTGLCVVLLVAAHCIAGRRRPSAGLVATAWAAAVAWLTAGGWVFYNVDVLGGYETAFEIKARAAAYRRHYGQYQHLPQPEYSRIDLDVAIWPRQRRLRSRGSAIVVNRHEAAVAEILFTMPRPLAVHALSLTGALLERSDRRHTRRYRLNRPLAPGETLRIAFDFEWRASGYPNAFLPARLLANGTFVTTAHLLPVLGYRPDYAQASSSAGNPRFNPFEGAGEVAFRARVSTSLDQVAVAPGERIREWKEEGRRYFDYQAEQPIPLFASIHSGRYEVARDHWHGTAIEIYHHPPHRREVPRMIAAARREVDRRPRPHPAAGRLRIVEVPAYRAVDLRPAWFARPPGSGAGPMPGVHPLAATGLLPYPERVGARRALSN